MEQTRPRALRAIHGTRSKYNIGCRCGECRQAVCDYMKSLRAAKNPPVHGTVSAYNNHGCRCRACLRAGSEWNSGKSALRRARLGVDLEYIASRDGWRCHICGGKVRQDAKKRSLRPSLDHLIPMSRGGPDTRENLRLAHIGCNCSMGVARLDAQLLLIG